MPNAPLPPAPEIPAEAAAPRAGWLRRQVLAPLMGLLRQGLAPEQLALTVALGIALGLVPFLGAIAPVATVAALVLRLNMAALQLVSHLMTPLQLLLLLPLLRLGARLLGGASAQNLTIASLQHLISTDWRGALSLLWRAELGALGLWLAGGAVLVFGLYFILKPLFRRLAARTESNAR